MADQRITIKLTKLRCIKESDPGGAEPYIWVTYFALGPQASPGPLALNTPSYDAFRTEFPDNIVAGSVVDVPTFIASAHFDMELNTTLPRLIGCVVLLMEEDNTRHSDIVSGRIAYTKEMHDQLNALVQKRIQTNDRGPLTDDEIEGIKSAVKSKVEDAVARGQSIWDIFRDQDDNIGFTYKLFPESEGDTIRSRTFDFPDIINLTDGPGSPIADHFVLSGAIEVGPVPPGPVVRCLAQRDAVEAQKQVIKSLQNRRTMLQLQLQTAPPGYKAALVQEINATNHLIDVAEQQLVVLEESLRNCMGIFHGSEAHGGGVVVADPTT